VINFLVEILKNETLSNCMCGLCLGELDRKIVQMNIPDSKNNSLCISNLKREDQKVVLKKTIESLKEINRSRSWFFSRLDSEEDVFFSSKGIFVRKVVLMLDYYFERKELHRLLEICLARAYLIRMENHYSRVNAHF